MTAPKEHPSPRAIRGARWAPALVLTLALAPAGCFESNPQPSPGGADGQVTVLEDTVGPGADMGAPDPADSAADLSLADGAAMDASPSDSVVPPDTNDPGCPAAHPWLIQPGNWDCDLPPGTACAWPAEGCAAGVKPDNVCTCIEKPGGELRFDCTRPFHNCLPLTDSHVSDGTTRPKPEHRETAETCEATPTPRADAVCEDYPSPVDKPPECETDADCAETGARCLETWDGMGTSLCRCHAAECTEDADCPGMGVCECGWTEIAASWCDGPSAPCHHDCLPADCRTDADCGTTQLCSPSEDFCGWTTVGYHCHDPEVVECFSDWECMGWQCIHEGTGWICNQAPPCD